MDLPWNDPAQKKNTKKRIPKQCDMWNDASDQRRMKIILSRPSIHCYRIKPDQHIIQHSKVLSQCAGFGAVHLDRERGNALSQSRPCGCPFIRRKRKRGFRKTPMPTGVFTHAEYEKSGSPETAHCWAFFERSICLFFFSPRSCSAIKHAMSGETSLGFGGCTTV